MSDVLLMTFFVILGGLKRYEGPKKQSSLIKRSLGNGRPDSLNIQVGPVYFVQNTLYVSKNKLLFFFSNLFLE